MRFAHISDMHLGLALNGYSFLEDQKYIMNQMSDIILKNNVKEICLTICNYLSESRYPCRMITAACLSMTFFLPRRLTSASMRTFSAITVVRRSS